MKIVHAAALALFSTVAVAAQAPTAPPGTADMSKVTGGTYEADPAHTLVAWTVDHFGITPYSGLFGDVSGTLTLDPADLANASVDMTIPVSKVTTASAGLTDHLLRPGKDGGDPDFFGADPSSARFVSTSVVPDGKDAVVLGNLTLNGITKPVALDVSFYGTGTMPETMGGKKQIGFHATGSILRSEFGIGYAIPMVSDKVDLDIVAAFVATPAQ